MNREEVIKLAREQGLPETETEGVFIVNTDDLGRMLAAEREACAKVCEDMDDEYKGEDERRANRSTRKTSGDGAGMSAAVL